VLRAGNRMTGIPKPALRFVIQVTHPVSVRRTASVNGSTACVLLLDNAPSLIDLSGLLNLRPLVVTLPQFL
jgi:hypothetical protein